MIRSPPSGLTFLDGPLIVEEKIDGANIGFSTASDGTLLVQNRGSYIEPGGQPQFGPLWPWLAPRSHSLIEALGADLMLFGEWCVAVHSVRYDLLPDWFLGFDVYDRRAARFYTLERRNHFLDQLGIHPVPHIATGCFTLQELQAMLNRPSAFAAGSLEGLYLRREALEWLEARAKLVRPEFIQAIGDHWSGKKLERNRLTDGRRTGDLSPFENRDSGTARQV